MKKNDKLNCIVKNSKRLWYKIERVVVDVTVIVTLSLITVKLIGA